MHMHMTWPAVAGGGALRPLYREAVIVSIAVLLVSLVTRSGERRERVSRLTATHRSGIGTDPVGCRGFTGPVPPPLWMSAFCWRGSEARAAGGVKGPILAECCASLVGGRSPATAAHRDGVAAVIEYPPYL
jgi:hypothetical protein